MSLVVVGVGDVQVRAPAAGSDGCNSTALITYALGSCIGLVVHDAQAGVGGLLHYLLPDSAIDAEKARATPAMFADTGIPLLLRSCYELGAEKKRLTVYAAGGAQPMVMENSFEIGKRNQLALRKLLWKAGLILRGESLGGTLSRTVRLEMGSGRIGLRVGGGAEEWVVSPVGSPRWGGRRLA